MNGILQAERPIATIGVSALLDHTGAHAFATFPADCRRGRRDGVRPRDRLRVLRPRSRTGESLSSIAAQDGLSVGPSPPRTGSRPTPNFSPARPFRSRPQGVTWSPRRPRPATVRPPRATATSTQTKPAPSATVPTSTSTSGSYVVQPGDTLSAIAARSGVSVDSLAAANGLNPNAFLLVGTVLHLSGSSASSGHGGARSATPQARAARAPTWSRPGTRCRPSPPGRARASMRSPRPTG